MTLDIGRDTLIALAAIGWADGTLDPEEAEAIRGAAGQLSLAPDQLQAVEQALQNPVAIEEVETVRMSRTTRLFTYAAAAWVAHIDGQLAATERQALDLLAERLGLSNVARERAEGMVQDMASAPDAMPRLDVLRLKSLLAAGLSRIDDD
jgi:uncharacterized membrane protein YebE (DUF533 family)